MLPLLAICALAFTGLFWAVLRLLRQAKGDGRRAARARHSAVPARFQQREPAELVLDESLSRLVPGKQPDWRFMVRERSTSAARPANLLRSDRTHFREDLGDLSDPVAPSRTEPTRRAG